MGAVVDCNRSAGSWDSSVAVARRDSSRPSHIGGFCVVFLGNVVNRLTQDGRAAPSPHLLTQAQQGFAQRPISAQRARELGRALGLFLLTILTLLCDYKYTISIL